MSDQTLSVKVEPNPDMVAVAFGAPVGVHAGTRAALVSPPACIHCGARPAVTMFCSEACRVVCLETCGAGGTA